MSMTEPVGLGRMAVRVRAPELSGRIWDGSTIVEVARDERGTEEPGARVRLRNDEDGMKLHTFSWKRGRRLAHILVRRST
jgi:hypothetical protein